MIIQDGELPSYYIFNFENEGFVVMPADFRAIPLLAFGSNGKFASKADTINAGLASMIEEYFEYTKHTRNTETKMAPELFNLWTQLYTGSAIQAPPMDDPCGINNPCEEPDPDGAMSGTETQWGPHMNTTWRQSLDFNNDCPIMGCSDDPDGRALVGCVAVAVGQIMRHYGHPNDIAWNQIPNLGAVASQRTAEFLRDVGEAVNMDYGCDGSSAWDHKALKAFRDDYDYSSSISKRDFALSECASEIRMGRPVYLSGCREAVDLFVLYVPFGCHAWVTDGLKTITSGSVLINYLWMNWGWGGQDNNWYLHYQWDPNTTEYDEHKRMIVNIYPSL